MVEKITKETVDNVAKLARIKLSTSDQQDMLDDMKSMSDLYDQLTPVNTFGVKPLTCPIDVSVNITSQQVKELLEEASYVYDPQHYSTNVEDGFITVPKVI